MKNTRKPETVEIDEAGGIQPVADARQIPSVANNDVVQKVDGQKEGRPAVAVCRAWCCRAVCTPEKCIDFGKTEAEVYPQKQGE